MVTELIIVIVYSHFPK